MTIHAAVLAVHPKMVLSQSAISGRSRILVLSSVEGESSVNNMAFSGISRKRLSFLRQYPWVMLA